jgi:hypothetical protein
MDLNFTVNTPHPLQTDSNERQASTSSPIRNPCPFAHLLLPRLVHSVHFRPRTVRDDVVILLTHTLCEPSAFVTVARLAARVLSRRDLLQGRFVVCLLTVLPAHDWSVVARKCREGKVYEVGGCSVSEFGSSATWSSSQLR